MSNQYTIEATMAERDTHAFDVITQDMGIADWYFCDGIERDEETWLVETTLPNGERHKPKVVRLPAEARHEVLLSTHGYQPQWPDITATLTRRSDGEVTHWVSGRKRRLKSMGRTFTCAYRRTVTD